MRVKERESKVPVRAKSEILGCTTGNDGVSSRGQRGSQRRKKVSLESTMYDSSDSYENHVIELRGSPNRMDALKNESPLGGDASDTSDNYFFRGEPDRDHGARRSSNTHQKRNLNVEEEDREEADEEEYEEPVQRREHDFIPGQLVWAKFARFPWWPAQVIDPTEVEEGTGGKTGSDTDLLVRFFGTYDYGWVDPFSNLLAFDLKLADRHKIRKKALLKGVDEALAWRSSGTFPDKWELTSKSIKQEVMEKRHSNGAVSVRGEVKPSSTIHEFKEPRAPRKRKPKILYEVERRKIVRFHLHTEEEGGLKRKPQRMQRRLRIMRQLGLSAPSGSPFAADYHNPIVTQDDNY